MSTSSPAARYVTALICCASLLAFSPDGIARGLGHAGAHGGSHSSAVHSSRSHSSGSHHSSGSRLSSGAHTSSAHSYAPKGHASQPKLGGSTSGHHRKTYSALAERDAKGGIARSEKARDNFKRAHPCPSTGKRYGACPGYTIDHVTPLKRGGRDDPSNMQWQTNTAARAKDRWE